jgi:tetratricopeptide (TPR) repeat protein
MSGRIGLGAAAIAMAWMLTGCTGNPINAHTGGNYYKLGLEAEAQGDYTLARENYRRALTNAQLGYLGPAAEAGCLYEWSRVTGYLGHYHEAERGFNEVLTLIDKAGRSADELRTPALSELARLLYDTGQYARAVPVYETAVSELQRFRLQMSDPVGFADFLMEYAQSLRAVGLVAEADAVSRRAAALREDHPGIAAKFRPKRY